MTAHTITALPQLRKELERIREQGYALDQEEAVEGLRCVAGPVFNHTGQIVAAFSVAGPAMRLTPARIPEIAQLVRETSQQISYRLGYRTSLRPLAGPPGGSPRAERGVQRGRTGDSSSLVMGGKTPGQEAEARAAATAGERGRQNPGGAIQPE